MQIVTCQKEFSQTSGQVRENFLGVNQRSERMVVEVAQPPLPLRM